MKRAINKIKWRGESIMSGQLNLNSQVETLRRFRKEFDGKY